ncbi:MAG: hypothetical protein FJ265_09485 [Planctomycetes bacterium]|nr:hypothetical protein [Planctomycetota bacterium]
MRLGVRSAACGALFAFAAAAHAQEPPRLEVLREWRWAVTTTVRCGAGDAARGLVALGLRETEASGWQLVLYAASDGREVRRFALAKEPAEVRFLVPGCVDVRLRDRDAILSTSHWHRLRCEDGKPVGEPWPRDRRDEDPVLARKLLRGEESPGETPCVYADREGVVSWFDSARSQPLVDRHARGLALTPDGRFAVVWLATRIVVVPAAGGEPQRIDLPREDVRALLPGDSADEFWIVTTGDLRLLRAGSRREVRRLPHEVEGITRAALAAGGGPFAFARGVERAVLVDAAPGRVQELDARGDTVVWSLDGKRVVVGGGYQGRSVHEPDWHSFSRDGAFRFALRTSNPPWSEEPEMVLPLDEHVDWVAGSEQQVRVDGEERQAGPAAWPQATMALGPREVVLWTEHYNHDPRPARMLRVELVELPSFHPIARFETQDDSNDGGRQEVRLSVAPAARRIAFTVDGVLRVLAVPAAPPKKPAGQG